VVEVLGEGGSARGLAGQSERAVHLDEGWERDGEEGREGGTGGISKGKRFRQLRIQECKGGREVI